MESQVCETFGREGDGGGGGGRLCRILAQLSEIQPMSLRRTSITSLALNHNAPLIPSCIESHL